ncbi:MAG: response regulator [Azospirillum sp.]|nr:response regulator [Azospirillum sp.]
MADILIVDDEDLIRRTIRLTLQDSGHRLALARNGQDAETLARSHHFDVVIVDMIMPEKDGIETILDFRRLMPGAKIIAISGGGRVHNFDFLEIARQVGASQVLRKPFVKREILNAVNLCLSDLGVPQRSRGRAGRDPEPLIGEDFRAPRRRSAGWPPPGRSLGPDDTTSVIEVFQIETLHAVQAVERRRDRTAAEEIESSTDRRHRNGQGPGAVEMAAQPRPFGSGLENIDLGREFGLSQGAFGEIGTGAVETGGAKIGKLRIVDADPQHDGAAERLDDRHGIDNRQVRDPDERIDQFKHQVLATVLA